MTDRKAMLELAERCEAASGADAALGEEALLACGWRKSPTGYFLGQMFGWSSPDGKTYFDHDHFRRYDPTASVDAALSLVPEGWNWTARSPRPRSVEPAKAFGRVESPDFDSVTWGKGENWITDVTAGQEAWSHAATPALALTAACLKARAQ